VEDDDTSDGGAGSPPDPAEPDAGDGGLPLPIEADAAPEPDEDATPPDADEPDASPPPEPAGKTCAESLDCMRLCGPDMMCMADCAAAVCPGSAESLEEILLCAADRCTPACLDQSSPECLTCMAISCALEGLACVNASCEP
jgi:hypothetical protein